MKKKTIIEVIFITCLLSMSTLACHPNIPPQTPGQTTVSSDDYVAKRDNINSNTSLYEFSDEEEWRYKKLLNESELLKNYVLMPDGQLACSHDICKCGGHEIQYGMNCIPDWETLGVIEKAVSSQKYSFYLSNLYLMDKNLCGNSLGTCSEAIQTQKDYLQKIKSNKSITIPIAYGYSERFLEPCDKSLCPINTDSKKIEEFASCGAPRHINMGAYELHYFDLGPSNIEDYACKSTNQDENINAKYEYHHDRLMEPRSWVCIKQNCDCGSTQIHKGESCYSDYLPQNWDCKEDSYLQCQYKNFEIQYHRACADNVASFGVNDYQCDGMNWICTKDKCDCMGMTIEKGNFCSCKVMDGFTHQCVTGCSNLGCTNTPEIFDIEQSEITRCETLPHPSDDDENEMYNDDLKPELFWAYMKDANSYQCNFNHWTCQNEICDCAGLKIHKGDYCTCEDYNYAQKSCAKACMWRNHQSHNNQLPKSINKDEYLRETVSTNLYVLCTDNLLLNGHEQNEVPLYEMGVETNDSISEENVLEMQE